MAIAAAASPGLASAQSTQSRLQGSWSMQGRVTKAQGVRGEHRGQRVTRSWIFEPACSGGPCRKVVLSRERSRHRIDRVVLRESGRGRYEGNGRFYVPLRCRSKVYPHGGIAYEAIRLSISHTQRVQSKRFATAIRATYTNTRRVNRTPCPGPIGLDAGTYTGTLTQPPAPPVAGFDAATDPATGSASFSDTSQPSNGVRVTSYRWDFGDPASGAQNTSTAKNPTHTYSAHGTYAVTVTVTDANGLHASTTHQILV